MDPILLLPIFFSFFATLFIMPMWIKKAKQIGLIWKDMNKPNFPKNVAGSGGLIVTLGFVFGVLLYVAIRTFILKIDNGTIEIFAVLTAILIAGMIGFIDDILGWTRGGLSKRSRVLLLIFAAIPLIVINAGESTMMGINFGIFYPLVLIPLGIVATSATFNFLAGYNGLEATQGILILSALAIATYFTGSTWISLMLSIMIVCLFAFYLFNKFPAAIFPGDALTYSVGALIGIAAIMGNIEKFAIFIFIPYILEVILKSRGKLKVQSFAKVNSDGTLEKPRNKYYGIEHIAIDIAKKIWGKAKENHVVFIINLFQLIIIILAFVLFRGSIF